MGQDEGAICLTLDKNRNFIAVGKRTATTAEKDAFNALKLTPESPIKSVIFSDKSNGVRLIADDVLQMPRNLTVMDRQAADFISEMVTKNTAWSKVFKNAGKMSVEDIQFLRSIDAGNTRLGEGYFGLKKLELKTTEAAMDFRFDKKPQIIIAESGGKIRVQNVNDINDAIIQANNTLKDKVIITIENEGNELSVAVQNKILNSNSTIRFVRDQPNLIKSLDNARKEVYPDISTTIFVSSVLFDDPLMPDLSAWHDSLTGIGINSMKW